MNGRDKHRQKETCFNERGQPLSARGWEQIPRSASQCGQTRGGVTDRRTWRTSCGAPAGPLPVCPSPSDGPETWGRGAASGRRLAWSRRRRCSQGHRRPRAGGGACLSAKTLEAGRGNKNYFGHHAKLFVFSRPSTGIYFTFQEASVQVWRSDVTLDGKASLFSWMKRSVSTGGLQTEG